MTKNKLISLISSALEELEISVDCIEIKKYNREENTVDTIILSVDYVNFGDNVAYKVKEALNEIADEYGVIFNKMYLDL